MILADMIKLDKYALQCDLAETYHIYNYREFPLNQVALFSVGLREDSRIKQKIRNESCSFDTILLASISDKLSCLLWQNSKDGEKGKNRPKSLVDKLLNIETNDDLFAFDTIEEFENKRKEILKKGG